MKKIQIGVFLLFILNTLVISSCSHYQSVLKSTDLEYKYAEAKKYYEEEDYYRALTLFEELITIYKGTSKAEEVYYFYSMCNYGIGDNLLASFHFSNFVQTFPHSKHAEECAFLVAYCYYLDSPGPALDQTNTLRAIDQFQLFANRYPESEKLEECNKLVDELNFKLETKTFNQAKLYYHIEDYKAATIAFKNLLNDYPSTKYKEECMYLSFKASYLYAKNSIEEKQLERYKATVKYCNSYLATYPEGENIKEAKKFLEASLEEIKKNNNSTATIQK
ncbi:MAG: outer membrane protein assembly factor BamD [Bacteroidia bacterium]|nr:outer membrane protein assembly factor BamD [Bacteroidia bacterium]